MTTFATVPDVIAVSLVAAVVLSYVIVRLSSYGKKEENNR
jgi:hypothetical protein